MNERDQQDRGGPCDQGMESIRSAMAFSRLSRTELYAMMGDGRLPFVKHGRRRLIPRAALIRALEAGLVCMGPR